ncbi:HpcH/HpaI aldolase family protein [Roseicyclus mahoneyensis]|uniref:2-keto-3-deoxy-L-rhamnonate aldolase RhmA n=1 Tax=Roseicyclus mahoneyensis TaxID=164332 RepID=A0A316GMA9_9RHOB|nr:aldolase/citrate lyase family protein [Roseicyclus mahoneyensis]PWK62054.1 2-keto-3-deoxy-L-rhamnonate aldolase RhmA [Roseicyclus mahoneyensis]
MGQATFRGDLIGGKTLVGTFMKTPAIDVLEVLILSGLDFVCLDAEHAPFDRAAMNACGALARAADLPLLVRVPKADAAEIGAALDLGALGVVVPHVIDVPTATRVARAARFGHGGRGFAGSTRWAGFGGSDMATLLERSRSETVVIAQIEDPEAVACCEDIAAVAGIDALFLGPADLSVAYGKTDQSSPELQAAQGRVGRAAKAAGKGYATFVADAAAGRTLARHGVNAWFVASEQAWIIAGARAAKAGLTAP